MVNANMKKMTSMMTEQFFQLATFSRESGTFPSKPEMNPKGLASSSRPSPFKNGTINVVISLNQVERLTTEILKNPTSFRIVL